MNEWDAELAALINKHCGENASDTPDHILAFFLTQCFTAFSATVQRREKWYGREVGEGASPLVVQLEATTEALRAMTKERDAHAKANAEYALIFAEVARETAKMVDRLINHFSILPEGMSEPVSVMAQAVELRDRLNAQAKDWDGA